MCQDWRGEKNTENYERLVLKKPGKGMAVSNTSEKPVTSDKVL